jgi:hypothetical protein
MSSGVSTRRVCQETDEVRSREKHALEGRERAALETTR